MPLHRPRSRDLRTIWFVSVAHGGSHFCQLVVPPLFPWIAPAFGLTNTQLGLLMSVFFVVSGFGQALAGFVVDRHGAERVLFGGLALLALAALGLGASPNYAVLLVFMGVAGLGNCVFHPVDFSILNARVQPQRLGHAYAAHGISGSLGWALAPVVVVGIAAATSWRMALFAVAGAALALLALVVWQREWLGVSKGGGAGHAHGPAQETSAAAAPSSFAFLRLPAVWACFGFFLVFAAALGGVQSFAPAAASRMHGISTEQVALCLSAYMVSGALGMVVGGQLLADPRRSARVAAFGFGFAALVALAIGLGHWPPAWVPVLCGVMGFGSGIAGPSRDLLVKQATPPGATGRVYGVVYSGLDAGLVVAPLLFGLLMDAGLYRAVWLGVAALFTLLIATAFNVRRVSSGRAVPGPA
ncbi:MAG: MFS transporter [Rubrivivax sp.]